MATAPRAATGVTPRAVSAKSSKAVAAKRSTAAITPVVSVNGRLWVGGWQG